MSAHHYFRDFGYCDSGMLPWLALADLMGQKNRSLSSMVQERMAKFPISGEINRQVSDAERVMKHVREHYLQAGGRFDETDGLSVAFKDWRFNLRKSNTEPLIRLNVEALGNTVLLEEKTAELLHLIESVQ